MNYLKLFENFQREQPLEKEDIIDLLEGTGINYTKIYEFPIRNVEEREFYLGWIIRCKNPEEWVYQPPRNYQVNIDEDRIEFIWLVKPHIDILLSKITTEWKEIKMWLLDLLKDSEKRISEKGFVFYKEGKWLFEQDLKNEEFWVGYPNIWSIFYSKYNMGYIQVNTFVWIILEHITNYKVVTTRDCNINEKYDLNISLITRL
jgi:hypothetical protein